MRFNESTHVSAADWTESKDRSEVVRIYDFLEEVGRLRGAGYLNGGYIAKVTVAGHARKMEQVTDCVSRQTHMAKWSDESMIQVFECGIRPAIECAGLKLTQTDKVKHISTLDDETIAENCRSRFLVASFALSYDRARGGAYCEASYALALGMPVIFTCLKK